MIGQFFRLEFFIGGKSLVDIVVIRDRDVAFRKNKTKLGNLAVGDDVSHLFFYY